MRTGQQSTENTLGERRLRCTGSFISYEWTTTASTTLGGSGFQEGLAKDKLERHNQEGSTKSGTHLERG